MVHVEFTAVWHTSGTDSYRSTMSSKILIRVGPGGKDFCCRSPGVPRTSYHRSWETVAVHAPMAHLVLPDVTAYHKSFKLSQQFIAL